MNFDVIVVGGGHAGCEAAHAAARKNKKTLLITSNIKNIADLPCNPSIGGSAKGVVVREVDALGGIMGEIADKSQIQIKKLNSKKGPAVQALRAQIDKNLYHTNMLEKLKTIDNLTIKESMIEDLIVENNKVIGVITENNEKITSKAVILTTGTYLKADILISSERRRSGPNGEKPSMHLSDNLRKLGFKIIRLKTGTPPRIDKESIDYSKTQIETGDNEILNFSHFVKTKYNIEEQIVCYLTYTNEKTHTIINANLEKSSMYGGIEDLESVGPRYCPSIEDKIVRFNDKERHQLFLEPVSLETNEIYIQGLSTSMPYDVQENIVKSISGLENSKILKYAYAIEYDAVYPTQLKQSLETKQIENLYMAGQINGTSGYEEAAGQGIIAGINAALKIENKEPLILKRNEAYIGVLIDDLVTKGVRDPYRLLTSRAEYRLLLRNDNADTRLSEYGYETGVLNQEKYNLYKEKIEETEKLKELLKNTKVTPTAQTNNLLDTINSTRIKDGIFLYDLLKRPEVRIKFLSNFLTLNYDNDVLEQVEIYAKYEGYITKAIKEAERMLNLEDKRIPQNIDYYKIHNLASEAKQKLTEVKPTSLGQAIRISGVNPSDIAILSVYIKKENKNE